MKLRKQGWIRKSVVWVVLVYLLGGALLYFFQDAMLFHPEPLSPGHAFLFDQPFEDTTISRDADNLNIVKFSTQNSKGIVLFFHGNRKHVEHYKKYPPFFLRNQYEVWMIEYPGFGKSTGKRNEERLYEQARIMYDLAVKQQLPGNIIIYGKSIGTGIAAHLASTSGCRQLIMETPYYSLHALAHYYFPIYPAHLMMKYHFPIHQYLHKVRVPVTIIHGTDDEIIPFKNAARLKKEHPRIQLIRIEKGRHNDLSEFPLFQQSVDSLLN